MIKLIPMAGEGSRFVSEGYSTPKPLIKILGVPMVIRAANDLAQSSTSIFICRDFHISQYKIDEAIKEYFPNSQFITVDSLTEGQACTCLLAKDLINNDSELIIGASDNGMIYDKQAFDALKETTDAIVFSFKNNVSVTFKPNQYGWADTDEQNNIKKMSVKKSISNNPINDHAVAGAFWFKKGKIFVEAAEHMIKQNHRINNEFYVDECINDLIELGYKAKIFEIENYICWGTPNDLRTFEYWQKFFNKMKFHSFSYGK